MITGALKNKIDKLWLEFHSGGITNPLTVIEQISYLVFARMLDMREMAAEKRASRTGKKDWKRIFPENRSHLRWSHLINLGAEEQLRIVLGNRTKDDPEDWKGLFQFFREEVVNGTTLGNYLRDAQCAIQKPGLLKTAINTVNELPLSLGDTKGDLYEYLLSKLTTAGVAGQFRTPRHIIRAMVEMLDVKPDETVCDPACGTGGFLIETMEYLKRTHTSKELVHDEVDEETGEPVTDDHGNPIMIYAGDQLDEYRSHIEKDMFHGFDFDSTMLRIAAMNMMLHGIDSPCIEYKDSLSEQSQVAQEYEGCFDVVLANPPFKGSIDHESVFKGLTSVAKTKKTELLFLVLMTRLLKNGGRCAVIVPDGVLFGSTSAHRAVRRMLIEENQLEGVISLPSGVFKPYAGVTTAVLIFTKGGKTDNVWFCKIEHDGYSLDDKRVPTSDDDIPDMIGKWRTRHPKKHTDRSKSFFFVPRHELETSHFDLSFSRYAEIPFEAVEYDSPQEIIVQMRELEDETDAQVSELGHNVTCRPQNGWREVCLGDICTLNYGKGLPARKRSGEGYPVYGSNGIVGYHTEAVTAGPTIIVGRKGSIGEIAYSRGPCWPIDTTYYIDEESTDADISWLAYALPHLRLSEMNKAAAVPGLNRDDAYATRLLLPPPEEQKRIADILNRANAIRENREKSLGLAGDLCASLSQRAFRGEL